MMNIFMSYDNTGFQTAVKDSDPKPFPKEEYYEVFEYLLQCGSHDWSSGNCESFQIYNEQGEIIFNSSNREENGEVA